MQERNRFACQGSGVMAASVKIRAGSARSWARIGFAVGRWRPTSVRNRANSLSIVAIAMLQLLDLLLQVCELVGQVQDLDRFDGMVQDRHGGPDLLAWLARRQIPLEGLDGLACGLLKLAQGSLDHLPAGRPVGSQESGQLEPVF